MSVKSQSLARKSIVLIFARLIVNVAGIAQGVILARMLLKYEQGTYNQVITITGYWILIALGLPESITYFIARSTSLKDKLEKQSAILTVSLFLSVAIMLILTVADPWIAEYFNNGQLRGLGLAIGLILVGTMVQSLFQNTSIVMDHVNDAAKMSISYSLGNIVVIVSLFFFKNGIQVFIYTLAAYNLLMMILRVITMMKYFEFKLRLKIDFRLYKEIFAYGIPISLSTMIGTISRYVDKTVVGRFFPPDQFADFSMAARELPYSIITGAIIAVLMPRVIENYNKGVIHESLDIWKKGIVSSSYLIFFAMASNILLAREIIVAMYSEKYLASVPIFIVYTFLLASRITYWGMFLQAMRKPRLVMYISIYSLVSNLVLNLAFIPIFGMVGSAIATIVTSYASVVIYIYYNCKYLHVKVTDLIPFRKVGSIIGVNALAFAVFWLGKHFFLDTVTFGGKEHLELDSVVKIAIVGGLWAGGYALVFRKDLKKIIASLKQ